jgi:hypothetical protein
MLLPKLHTASVNIFESTTLREKEREKGRERGGERQR